MSYAPLTRQRWRTWIPVALVTSIAVACAALVILALRPDPVTQPRAVRVVSGEWAPYAGAALPEGGPVIRIMRQVLQSAGYEPQVEYTSWDAVEQRVADGSVFAAYPLVQSVHRGERMLFSDPILDFEYVMFVADSGAGAEATSLDDLAALRVGGVVGYDYWPELDAAAGDIVRFSGTGGALRALAAGEVDIVVEGRLPGGATLMDPTLDVDASGIREIDADWARSTQSLYMAVPDRPENRAVLAELNAALESYRASDDYASAAAELDAAASGRAHLVDADGSGLIALSDKHGVVRAHTPAGTRVAVLAWPSTLAPRSGPPAGAGEPVRVKIVNGPAAGAIRYVAVENLELDE